MSTKQPKRITMPGMIYEANEVLGWAMDPKTGGLHPDLFGPSLQGIAFLTIVEAGFVFSGNVGTGIVMARNKDGSFSPPLAVGLTGVGWGFILGASLKHIVYLIYDQQTLKTMSGDAGIKLSSQIESAVGTWGRTAEATTLVSNKGLGSNIALSYSSGLFGGFSVEGALMAPRSKVNEKFYGKKMPPKDILFGEMNALTIPDGTLLPEVYAKLKALTTGQALYEMTQEEKAKKEAVKAIAEKEGEEFLKEEDVKYEDVAALEKK